MSRRLRRVVLIVVALAIAGAAAALLLVRPDLEDARNRVNARWVTLREPFAARYDALANVAKALSDAGAAERAVTKALDDVLPRWSKLALRGPTHTDPGLEATAANELEALARRVRANILASARLNANPGVKAAMVAFDQTLAPAPAVTAYNVAVRSYEDAREGIIHRLVAGVLGYDSRPALIVG